MKITKELVEKALQDLSIRLEEEDDVEKASKDLDQAGASGPEGSDLSGGHMKKKMSDEAPEGKDKEKEEDAEKSFVDELPEEIQTKIDVSDFLKSLVDHTGEVIDSLNERVVKSDEAHSDAYDELSKAVNDISDSQAKLGVVLKAICEKIGVIENAPATEPRAEVVVKSGQPVDRTFENGLKDDNQEPMFKSLSQNPQVAKSQISSVLCDLVKSGDANDMDVIGFESGNYIRPELVSKLKQALN